jgi:hypothetical protein
VLLRRWVATDEAAYDAARQSLPVVSGRGEHVAVHRSERDAICIGYCNAVTALRDRAHLVRGLEQHGGFRNAAERDLYVYATRDELHDLSDGLRRAWRTKLELHRSHDLDARTGREVQHRTARQLLGGSGIRGAARRGVCGASCAGRGRHE